MTTVTTPAESLEASVSPRHPQGGVGIQKTGVGSIPDAGNPQTTKIPAVHFVMSNGKRTPCGIQGYAHREGETVTCKMCLNSKAFKIPTEAP